MNNKLKSAIYYGREIERCLSRLDSTTYNHSIRVMEIAVELEEYCGYNDKLLSTAALVHDIGKIYITSKILDKKGQLSPLERELVNLHPYIGYDMLKTLHIEEDVCRMVLYHHGLNPIVIKPLDPYDKPEVVDRAALLRSIDCYEALTSDRSYHRGYLAGEALDIMLEEPQHHPKFLDYLKQMTAEPSYRQDSKIFRKHSESNSQISKLVMSAVAM